MLPVRPVPRVLANILSATVADREELKVFHRSRGVNYQILAFKPRPRPILPTPQIFWAIQTLEHPLEPSPRLGRQSELQYIQIRGPAAFQFRRESTHHHK